MPPAQGSVGCSVWTHPNSFPPSSPHKSRVREMCFLASVRMCRCAQRSLPVKSGMQRSWRLMDGTDLFTDNLGYTGWFLSSDLLPLKRVSFLSRLKTCTVWPNSRTAGDSASSAHRPSVKKDSAYIIRCEIIAEQN